MQTNENVCMHRIRELRMRANLTQAELSVLSGVPMEIITGLEDGTVTTVKLGILRKICRALNCAGLDVCVESIFVKRSQ